MRLPVDGPSSKLIVQQDGTLLLDKRCLTTAVLKALELFSNPRYERFLAVKEPGLLDQDWFDWFVGAWAVARTINKDARKPLCRYLNSHFRQALLKDQTGQAVDSAVQQISERGWGARRTKAGGSSSTLSLVSKVAFLFKPDLFTPLDSFALTGLRCLAEAGRANASTYQEYLVAFEAASQRLGSHVTAALHQGWVGPLATQLGLESDDLRRPAIQRKVVDNLLMQSGGRDLSRDG
jgi:hypothetical protein